MLDYFIKYFIKILFSLVLIGIIIYAIFLCLFLYNANNGSTHDEYQDLKYYRQSLQECCRGDEVKHFPLDIPEESCNVRFYAFSSFLGKHIIMLKIETNKDFIEKELAKYNYNNLSPEVVGEITKYIKNCSDKIQVNTNNTDLFVIKKDFTNKNTREKMFSGYSGFVVDKSKNYILYFYINPEG